MVKWPPGDGDDAIVSLFRAFFDQVAAAAVVLQIAWLSLNVECLFLTIC